jgi:mRNA-degrading endonuclease toxin of MazEF toxin-antitoxin module
MTAPGSNSADRRVAVNHIVADQVHAADKSQPRSALLISNVQINAVKRTAICSLFDVQIHAPSAGAICTLKRVP